MDTFQEFLSSTQTQRPLKRVSVQAFWSARTLIVRHLDMHVVPKETTFGDSSEPFTYWTQSKSNRLWEALIILYVNSPWLKITFVFWWFYLILFTGKSGESAAPEMRYITIHHYMYCTSCFSEKFTLSTVLIIPTYSDFFILCVRVATLYLSTILQLLRAPSTDFISNN